MSRPDNGQQPFFAREGRIAILYALISLLVVLHLVLLIPAIQHPDRFLTRDSLDYLDLARTWLSSGHYQGTVYPGIDIVRSPGYPIFVALGLWLGGGNTSFISIMQTILLLVSAWLVYRVSAETGYPKAGLLAVIFVLLDPNAAFWSITIMSEILAAFFLVLGTWCVVLYWTRLRIGWIFGAGLAFSAGALTRPILYPLSLIIVLLFFLLEWRRSRQPIHSLGKAALYLTGVLALVLPWQLRNLSVHGQFTLSEVGISTFENWYVANTLASAEGLNRDEASAQIAKAPDPFQYSLAVIQRYPAVFVKEQARGILRTALGAEYGTWAKAWGGQEAATTGVLSAFLDQGSLSETLRSLRSQLGNAWFWAGMYALLFDIIVGVAIFIGVWKAVRGSRWGLAFNLAILLGLGLLYLLIIPGAAGESRFRVPAAPWMAILAGWMAIRSQAGGNSLPRGEEASQVGSSG